MCYQVFIYVYTWHELLNYIFNVRTYRVRNLPIDANFMYLCTPIVWIYSLSLLEFVIFAKLVADRWVRSLCVKTMFYWKRRLLNGQKRKQYQPIAVYAIPLIMSHAAYSLQFLNLSINSLSTPPLPPPPPSISCTVITEPYFKTFVLRSVPIQLINGSQLTELDHFKAVLILI